jgi:CheY-like chemotaxis protein
MGEKECLVIDDVTTVQKILDGMVEALGFAPVNASDGLEGLVRFEQRRTPLVLVDAEITGRLNAEEVATSIKHLAPETFVIIVTEGESTIQREAASQADAILHKPFGLGALQSALRPLSRA